MGKEVSYSSANPFPKIYFNKTFLIITFLLFHSINYGQVTDSLNIQQPIDSIKSESSISPFVISGQLLGGAVSGLIFLLPFRETNPVYGVAGWIFGSTLGVYLIGRIGDYESSYWGTALGGGVGISLFVLLIENKTLDGYEYLFGALLSAIPFEILGYYVFATEKPQNDFNQTDLLRVNHTSSISDFRQLNKPDVSINILRINF
ncbi:MAG: hypothetical protein IPM56_00325 [Ignavibacteriales bacterium]|nr:MAG: hypothetical protein IPM56_00325 [Ignavibacteriales bacterium]